MNPFDILVYSIGYTPTIFLIGTIVVGILASILKFNKVYLPDIRNSLNSFFKFKSGLLVIVVGILVSVAILIGIGGKTLPFRFNLPENSRNYLNISPPPKPPAGQEVPLQEVKNLGYIFYVGEIDNPNTTNITDDIKNQITKIAYDANFPKNMLKDIPIIILNNLALTGDQYISVSGKYLKIPDLKPDFLSEGGLYLTFSNGLSFIVINKPIIAKGEFREVLTHELGHAISDKLTDQDWVKYYQLRDIPSSTSRKGTSWNLSPREDFAEIYKYTFTGLEVRTFYGFLKPTFVGLDIGACREIYQSVYDDYLSKIDRSGVNPFTVLDSAEYKAIEPKTNNDPRVQNCRREVLSSPDKYSEDWRYGTPYRSVIDQSTKDFIVGIMNRLNQ